MTKCKDCMHYELCKYNAYQEVKYFGKDKEIYISIDNNSACKFFKFANVTEVVHCKDCQYFISKENLTDKYDNPLNADGLCDNFPRICYTDKQDYCSCGKRKIN